MKYRRASSPPRGTGNGPRGTPYRGSGLVDRKALLSEAKEPKETETETERDKKPSNNSTNQKEGERERAATGGLSVSSDPEWRLSMIDVIGVRGVRGEALPSERAAESETRARERGAKSSRGSCSLTLRRRYRSCVFIAVA